MIIYIQKLKGSEIRGFTLVEILVVLALFSTVMTIASGALFTTQAINTKLQETQALLDNVNLSVETITREVRYGSNFHCDTSTTTATFITLRQNCTFTQGGGGVLFFKPTVTANDGDRVAYYVSPNGVLYKDEYIGGATTTYQISADDVTIKSMVFYVTGANTATGVGKDVGEIHDYTQPLVTIVIAGETRPVQKSYNADGSIKDVNITKFTIETSVSSRKLDN